MSSHTLATCNPVSQTYFSLGVFIVIPHLIPINQRIECNFQIMDHEVGCSEQQRRCVFRSDIGGLVDAYWEG